MTLSQFIDYVRNRHCAASDPHWSDAEIYSLITNRCNEVLSIIGLLEATDTSQTTTASTQAYDFPSDASTIRQVNYLEDRLQRIPFRKWQLFKDSTASDYTINGRPSMWVKWNRQILLVPTPDTTGSALTIYYYKTHPFIDNSAQTTIDIPAVLHGRLADGVLADMFVKDLNEKLASFYEGKWINVHIPAFHRFKSNEDTDGRFQIVGDGDTEITTSLGVV